MNKPENDARAYCRAIGANPDEMARGYIGSLITGRVWAERPRWQWYVGVSDAALRRPLP